MKIYNQEKTQILEQYDLDKGRLVDDSIIHIIPAVDGQEEQGHYETVTEYANGGKDVKWVVDTQYIAAQPEKQEVEQILVYVPFSAGEQAEYDRAKYESLVECKIRERYTIGQELAILRQRDEKSVEYQEYYDYCEKCKADAKSIAL